MAQKSRATAVVLLAVFATALFAPAVASLEAHHDETTEHADHGGSCPDGDGQPCSDGCNCLCCPGHLRALVAVDEGLERFDNRQRLLLPLPPELPGGVAARIFHPPRIG